MTEPDLRAWPDGTAHEHARFLAGMFRDLPDATLVTVPLQVIRILAFEPADPGHPARDVVQAALVAAAADQIPRWSARQIERATDLVCDALRRAPTDTQLDDWEWEHETDCDDDPTEPPGRPITTIVVAGGLL